MLLAMLMGFHSMLVGRYNKVVKVVQTRQQEDNTSPSRQNKEEYLKTKAHRVDDFISLILIWLTV